MEHKKSKAFGKQKSRRPKFVQEQDFEEMTGFSNSETNRRNEQMFNYQDYISEEQEADRNQHQLPPYFGSRGYQYEQTQPYGNKNIRVMGFSGPQNQFQVRSEFTGGRGRGKGGKGRGKSFIQPSAPTYVKKQDRQEKSSVISSTYQREEIKVTYEDRILQQIIISNQEVQDIRSMNEENHSISFNQEERKEKKHKYEPTELRTIQNKKPINFLTSYKEYSLPDYFQGPTFTYNREPHPENKTYVNFKSIKYERGYVPPRRGKRDFSDGEMYAMEKFDFKQEKKMGNKFWKGEVPESRKLQNKKTVWMTQMKMQAKMGTETHRYPKKQNLRQKMKEEVLDKKQKHSKGIGKGRQTTFEEHIPKGKYEEAVEKGQLFEGILRISQTNSQRGFVNVEGFIVDVMIDGGKDLNRAMDGDTVILQLIPPQKWQPLISANGKPTNTQSVQPEKGGKYTNEGAIETRIVDLMQVENANGSEEFKKTEVVVSSTIEKEESKVESESAEESESSEDEETGSAFLKDQKVESDEEEKVMPALKEKKGGKVDPKYAIIEGNNRRDVVAKINNLAQKLRPLGRVQAIKKSPAREKDLFATLICMDKKQLDTEALEKMFKDQQHGSQPKNLNILAVPVNKKLPWMQLTSIPQEYIDDLKNERKPNQRYYEVKFSCWNCRFSRPMCDVVRSIGEAGNLDVESLRILKTFDVNTEDYEVEGQSNSNVHESLKVFTSGINEQTGEWRIPEEELKIRVDLRKKRIFTIDPITAKDLDDALSIEKITDTIYEIGVHIADVSYFVQQGSKLDEEAQLRCTSVYFVHKVYPMLPRLLCERLCSLNPQVDRLTYSIFFRMDIRTGELDKSFKPRLQRSVIRSCAKWHYQLVQDILDGKIKSEEDLPEIYRPKEQAFKDMRDDCLLMNEIAQKRRQKRLDNGSVVLTNREFVFKLDENKLPEGFEESYRIESKFLVEEYMLLANILVAEHLYHYCKDKTLLRAHPDVDADKKILLQAFFERVGLGEIDLTNSKTLSLSMEVLKEKGDQDKFNVALRKFLTCLQAARYMCINEAAPEQYQHYGLNFPLYTHFTSPIRRYADLLVHRLVTITLQEEEKTRAEIEQINYSDYAEQCSEKSLNAKKASTQCQRLFHCLLLQKQGMKVYETLLFDMDSGTISLYIEEINLWQKMRLRDDKRVDATVYFEEEMAVAVLLKEAKKGEEKGQSYKESQLRKEKFQNAKNLAEVKSKTPVDQFLVLRIFDRVKVFVETTTEFPLDIVCKLVITKEDEEKFAQMKVLQDARDQEKAAMKIAVEVVIEDQMRDEI